MFNIEIRNDGAGKYMLEIIHNDQQILVANRPKLMIWITDINRKQDFKTPYYEFIVGHVDNYGFGSQSYNKGYLMSIHQKIHPRASFDNKRLWETDASFDDVCAECSGILGKTWYNLVSLLDQTLDGILQKYPEYYKYLTFDYIEHDNIVGHLEHMQLVLCCGQLPIGFAQDVCDTISSNTSPSFDYLLRDLESGLVEKWKSKKLIIR